MTTYVGATVLRIVPLMVFVVLNSLSVQAATLFQQVGVASSPNPVGSGARAMGMGGAFIAIADDATAASWNPAGLIQLESPEISIVGAYMERKEDFSSGAHPEIAHTNTVDDFHLNYFSATYPFEFYKNMVVSINFQRLFEFERELSHRFDFTSAGVNLVQDKHYDQSGYLGALGIAYAIEITPRLSLGATLNIWTDELFWENEWKEVFTERGVGTQGGAPVTIETEITDKYEDFQGINVNVGLLWDINNYLTLGAVLKTPFDADIRHKFDFNQRTTFGAPVNTTVASSNRIREDVELQMPLSYGLGLAWRVSDALSFDMDVYRTEWSDYVLIDSQGNKFSPIDGRPENASDVEDTIHVRLGGEYLFISERQDMVIPLRAGVFYDPEPAHDDVKDFYGIAIGSGVAYKGLIFDVAYQFRWGNDIDTGNLIATSEADVRQHLLLGSLIIHF